jgi:hypothetical protein
MFSGPEGQRKGLSNTQQLNQPKVPGSGRSNGATNNHPNQNPSPPADLVILQRETTENRLEKDCDQVLDEGHHLQGVEDQDTELEYVQETPMDGGQHHQNMC